MLLCLSILVDLLAVITAIPCLSSVFMVPSSPIFFCDAFVMHVVWLLCCFLLIPPLV